MNNENLFKAKALAQEKYLAQPGIVGMGFGHKVIEGETTDELSLVVMVEKKLPLSALSHKTALPPIIHNVATDIMQVGKIRISPPAQAQSRKDKWRPAPPGVSLGHYKITAGTFGAVVQEKVTGNMLMLTNNHVAANSNDANHGDDILQPGPYDGGSAGDVIGDLHRFVPIDFGQIDNGDCPLAESYVKVGNMLAKLFRSKHLVKAIQVNPQAVNLVDAAVVKPLHVDDIKQEILDIGIITGTEEATLGMQVEKSGRTTEYTEGRVTLIDAIVDVDYGGGKQARFERQIISGPMSQGGDSGSLLVSKANKTAVGLLFAGSNQVTIYNPIDEVLHGLLIEI
jgi:hypothetical protein